MKKGVVPKPVTAFWQFLLRLALFFGSSMALRVLLSFAFLYNPKPTAMFYLIRELKIAIASLVFSLFGSAMYFFETMIPLSKWFLLVGFLGIVFVLYLIFRKSRLK